ncbi:hypothetical protein BARVI_01540 [Barnesiella viscericola DSM 18177]|uniref:Uncharacterized protein n=1 Tax=Barnesiella viscericola DSM 18177 TaxID=880074 RepID=W0ERY1_9BACT|nr:hypothetical protein [Barnesiella viscericola]AHF13570.1 hypothetical protein BARVI_01540 [Barnesiella viscericola DSM 18177]
MRAFLLLLLSLAAPLLHAERTITNPAWIARNTPVVTVDSILLRDTLCRLYITLKQLPHTTLTLHDDWVIQDSLGHTIGRVKDIDGVDFNRIFQFESDSTQLVEMDFPALPSSLEEFDLTGNQGPNEIRIIGVSLTKRQTPGSTQAYSQPTPPTPCTPLPELTFQPDTAWLQGQLIGYQPRLNLPEGKIELTDLFTGQHTTIAVPLAADGSFAVAIPLRYPIQQRMIFNDRYLPFYLEPTDTLYMQVPLDELFAPYRYIGEIEQNCTHLIYRGRNARINEELRQVRLKNSTETEAWIKAFNSLSPRLYQQSEIDKFQVKLQQLKHDCLNGKLSRKSYALSILNDYYLFISHLLVYNQIKGIEEDYEYIKNRNLYTPFAILTPLDNPLSTASTYYPDLLVLLERRESLSPPPIWESREFIEALENRGIILSPSEREALKFALGECHIPPENVQTIIEQLNKKSEKEQIAMREERLQQQREANYRLLFGPSDDFTCQLLDTRRIIKLIQQLHRALSPEELEEFTQTITDTRLQQVIEQINSAAPHR